MKIKLVLTGIIAAMTLVAGACNPAAQAGSSVGKTATIDISNDELANNKHITRQIEIVQGGTLTLVLASNASTGFSWNEQAQIADKKVLEQTGHQNVAPTNTSVVGAAGQEKWTFKALAKGTTTVAVAYSQPWNGGQKGVWTVDLTVTVK
jgi:inhibitor of cysteine peptidase